MTGCAASLVLVARQHARGAALCGVGAGMGGAARHVPARAESRLRAGRLPPRPGVALARLFHGRVYLDASTIQWLAYDALGVAPALTNSMLGGPQPAIAAPAVGRTRKWLHGWRILTYSRRAIPIRLAANTGLPRQAARARPGPGSPARGHRGAGPTAARAIHRAAVRRRPVLPARLGRRHPVETAGTGRGGLPGQSHALTAALMAGGAPSVTAAQSYALMDLAALAPMRRRWPGCAHPTGAARTGATRCRQTARFAAPSRTSWSATAIAPSTKPICVIRAGAKRRIICWTAC